MFYNEQGKHARTRKEILDENGDIRKGCKIEKKGEVYERNLFTAKNKLFKQDEFMDEVKHFYTDLINTLVKDDKEKLHAFDENVLYLATKKIGKNNSKAEQIQPEIAKQKPVQKLPEKGELQSRIDSKNGEIDILKIGLSGIAKRYGYQNMQEFYRTYHKSHSAYVNYKEHMDKREKIYGKNNHSQGKESVYERLKNPPKKPVIRQQQQIQQSKDRGAR